MWSYTYTDELYHYGIKGQKWGVRRYEDASGHLTSAGKNRYGNAGNGFNKQSKKRYQKQMGRMAGGREYRDRQFMAAEGYNAQVINSTMRYRNKITGERQKRALQQGNTRKANRLERRMDKRNSIIKYNEKVIRKVRNTVTNEEWKNRAIAQQIQVKKRLAGAYAFPYSMIKTMQADRVRKRLGLDNYKYTPSKQT